MDPLTAVSLGANILQFVEFVTRLVSVSREIRESTIGSTVENTDLEAATRSTVWLNQRVADSLRECTGAPTSYPGENNNHTAQEILSLASACDDVARELLQALDKLKAKGRHPSWTGGVVKALKTVWTKAEIDSLRSRLQQYHASMQAALIFSIR
jgi:hypothetical protein